VAAESPAGHCPLHRSIAATSCIAPPCRGRHCALGQPAQQGARKVFFDNPDYLNVRVSPDGANLAWVAPIDSVNNLWVAPVADVGAARPVTRITGRSIATCYRWTHTTVI
jgi:hypothetical protein